LISPAAPPTLAAMRKLFSGLFGFMLCLLIGILVDEVALGILAGMFLGAILGSRKTEAANDARDGEAAPPSSEQ
jgi:hypothetical protein